MKKSLVKLLSLALAILVALPLAAAVGTPAAADVDEEVTYTVIIDAGRLGYLTGRAQITQGDSGSAVTAVQTKSGDGTRIIITGVKYGQRVSYDAPQVSPTRMVTLWSDVEDKYYVKGMRLTGRDNNELEVRQNIPIEQDEEFVVAYGIRGNMVAYSVRYLDLDGKSLAPTRTYYGNVGDRPVVAYLYIDGYQPQAYNLMKTLVENEAQNIFTFIYKKVPTATTGGGGGGQAGQPTQPTNPTQPTETTAPVETTVAVETTAPTEETTVPTEETTAPTEETTVPTEETTAPTEETTVPTEETTAPTEETTAPTEETTVPTEETTAPTEETTEPTEETTVPTEETTVPTTVETEPPTVATEPPTEAATVPTEPEPTEEPNWFRKMWANLFGGSDDGTPTELFNLDDWQIPLTNFLENAAPAAKVAVSGVCAAAGVAGIGLLIFLLGKKKKKEEPEDQGENQNPDHQGENTDA